MSIEILRTKVFILYLLHIFKEKIKIESIKYETEKKMKLVFADILQLWDSVEEYEMEDCFTLLEKEGLEIVFNLMRERETKPSYIL